MPNNQTTKTVTQEILRAVEEIRGGTGFGSIEVTVHEGRVTFIEKRERLRVQHTSISGKISKLS
ncbi:YezD family protein [Methylotenera sp.]|uniref:YezD family protein n=1 Tax=Methylotenera sp. TaxID=2051956 RepID=UPI0025F735E8|nr:YezD family protein [uncultured Methylotenera sp.]